MSLKMLGLHEVFMILMHGMYTKLLDDLVGTPMTKYGKMVR